jgi:hypothetical protein
MVRDGDPLKRACDVNESYGAKLKYILRNLVVHRLGTKKKYMHKRVKTTGKSKVNLWPQSFS